MAVPFLFVYLCISSYYFMKRIVIILLAAIAVPAVSANAQKRSLEQMTEIARQALGISDDGEDRITTTRSAGPDIEVGMSSPQLAVFNRTDGGWVIVSASERTSYSILAYGTEGSFDWETAPVNVKDWVADYQNQIDSLDANEADYIAGNVSASVGTPVVGPLVSSKWGQGNPYNSYCPNDSKGKLSITGCVATAMAQIMYYWKNNTDCDRGVHTNGHYPECTVDFSQSVYDWNSMRNAYSGSYTQIQAKAVAKLMYDCGVAIDMEYSSSSSSAYSGKAQLVMPAYFGFSTDMKGVSRNSYYGDWDAMLKKELDAGRPILYSGQGSGGHAFVCDGYDSNGLFHFNWGWNGSYDGYFESSVLTPSSGHDYSNSQDVCVNIYPAGTEDRAIWQNGCCFGKCSDGWRMLSYDNNGSTLVLKTPKYVEAEGKQQSYLIPDLLVVADSHLTDVEINGATEIGTQAFMNCPSLQTISLIDKTKVIDGYAIIDNPRLETIYLGPNVTQVGNNAFDGSTGLKTVYCMSKIPPTANSNAFSNSTSKEDMTLYVPSGDVWRYKMAPLWKEFGKIVKFNATGADAVGQDASDSPWYNLMGVPADSPVAPGIYMRDGRKYLF